MSTALRSVELASGRQALVTGQVVDALTGSGITPDSIVLEMRFPDETDFRPVRADLRLGAAGYFAFHGTATQAFPQTLEADEELALRFSVTARSHTAQQVSVNIPATAITAPVTPTQLGGHELAVRIIAAPVQHQMIELAPLPVGLNGLVISDHDLDSPLEGASIQVIEPVVQPAVLSNADGRFRINALPLSQSVTLQVELGDVSTTINHVVDYTTSFNTRIISLNG